MKLLNFELETPYFGIALVGLDFLWDLHNVFTFLSVNLDATSNVAVMTWTASGHTPITYSGCRLVFSGLKLLVISARDGDLPLSEDLCVSSISKVLPEPSLEPELRMKAQWGSNEAFHLLFQFQSGRSIEIDADAVELDGRISPGAR
ncbi:MAG TPA: hypothetical protein VGJ09_15700 [Bryobacteraceae bacterium]|jgi:hypothetical protein